MKKKILSLLLALVLVLSLLPVTALAGNVPEGSGLPDFSASVGATPLTVVLTEQNGYTPCDWGGQPLTPVTLYIVPVPDGAESVDLKFTDNVLAYCYSADGKTPLDTEDRYPGDGYLVGAKEATVPVDASGDGKPDCVQVQTPYDATTWNSDVLYAITFQCASFSAFDVTTKKELKGISKEEDGYIPTCFNDDYSKIWDGEPVPIYTVTIPESTETVNLSFSENVIFYNYSADGDYLGGKDRLDGSYIISGDVEPASVDYNNDDEFDYIVVQTPYYDGSHTVTLFVITFANPLAPFSAFVGDTELTQIKLAADEDRYIPYVFDADYNTVPGDPVPTYVVTIPEDAEKVDLEFGENVLAYNYSPDGVKCLAGKYDDFTKGDNKATVPVDADGDGNPDYIQVQTPYDATTYETKQLYAITFDNGGSSGGAKEITEASLLSALAAAYAENGPGSDDNTAWIAADMSAYAGLKDATSELTAAQKENVKNAAIKTLFDTKKPGDAAKNIIALVALGYDPTQLTAADGTKFSAKEKIDALAFESGAVSEAASNLYTLPYVIMGYRLLKDADSLQKLQKLIDKAIDIQSDWMVTTYGVDGMTPYMVALAPEYSSNSKVKAALDDAIKTVKGVQLEDGCIPGWSGDSDAASTGLAIAGFTALGMDPHEIKNGDKNLIDGLLAIAAKYNGTSLGGSAYDEQGFRGLIAAAKGKGYTTYAFDTSNLQPAADLSLPYVAFNIQPDNAGAKLVFTDPDGKEVTAGSAGVFEKLAVGTYSYTVSAEGYETKSGKVTVSADTCETINVSLVRSEPKNPESKTAVVTVKVLSHDSTACDGKYTYKYNASAYYSILGEDESYAVTVEKGVDTARDVLVATLAHYDNIHFTEKSNGYFSEINHEEEFSHGPNSGWLYLVNGESATVAAKDFVFNGDATMIWYFSDDYTKEAGSEAWTDGGTSGTAKADTTDTAPAEVEVKPEVVDGEAKAEVKSEDVAKAIEAAEDAEVLTVKVDTTDADKVEAKLDADAVKAAADADLGLKVETEVGAVKVDSKTMDALAGTGKDVAVTVASNSDGTTTIGVTAGGEDVDAKVKVELPAAESGKVLVVVDAEGKETVVKKSAVDGDKMYAELPAGSTVKVVDADGKDFGDVKDSDWFAESIEFVTSHGLFQGTGDDSFDPDLTMNRAMLVTVLYRLEDAKAEGGSTFGDVDPAAWYADAAAWASEAGIVTGTDAGFEPDAPVTREQIATMLYRYANVIGLDTSAKGDVSSFSDGGETSGWAGDAMAWAVGVGLFQGDDNGALNPGGEATRAQVAALFERLVELIVK